MEVCRKQYCLDLIDELDGILAEFHIATGVNAVPVVAANRDTGIADRDYLVVKNKLLGAMKDAFIDKKTCSLLFSELLVFCHDNGLEFSTQHVTPGKRVYFHIRTPGFDLIVEHTK